MGVKHGARKVRLEFCAGQRSTAKKCVQYRPMRKGAKDMMLMSGFHETDQLTMTVCVGMDMS